ncbi:calcium-binding protein [Pararhizobium sp. YC-54]|uniref:calcium-binding protein n=1 Tax=Pararhizobium sp. YC-54 TaxID=2986920 RepID=UPI0021F71B05|nr:calcium-binding protein [Pararhizobium sp. YC-54]MCV9997304.1 calcium-binding protein [Pararhizobium sp. YC-54]
MSKFIAHTATDMGNLSYENFAPADFQSPADPAVTSGPTFVQYDYGTVDVGNYNRFEGTFQYSFSGSDVSSVSGTVSYLKYWSWYTIDFGLLAHRGYTISDFALNVTDFQNLSDTQITAAIFAGDDTITGSDDDDTLLGFAGNDLLKGSGGYEGDYGSDILDGGAGEDIMVGGHGSDIYYVDNSRDIVWEFQGEGTDTVRSTISYLLPSYVDNLELLGTSSINATGNYGNNRLTGNDGDNVLNGGAARDTMYGGKGNDTYYVDQVGDKAIESPSSGTDLVYASVSHSIAGIHIENLTLTGTSNINATGNGLANTLIGNIGANSLTGDAGNDKLIGGAGADKLYGGTGADTFLFLFKENSTMSTRDMIYDFSRSQGDKIGLSVIDANDGRAGNQAFIFVGEKAFSHMAQELRYSNTNGDTYVYGDINGDGNADFSVRLDGNIELIKSDFVL